MSWILLNPGLKRDVGHFYFANSKDDRVAVSDWSITNLRDPASTDDGLLIIDRSQPIRYSRGGVDVPIVGGYRTSESLDYGLELVQLYRQEGLVLKVEPDLEALITKLVPLMQGDW